MMIRECVAHALPEPDFMQRGGEFTITVWRDWLTDKVLAAFKLNERQIKAISYLKIHGKITNSEYQDEYSVAKRTASRDLDELITKGIIKKVGTTGKGVYYCLTKGAIKGPKGPRE